MKTISFGSLFAGVGGFDLGLEAAGWVCGFQVEWDKNCLQTLQYHWPNVPKWGDVSDVNGADLPPVDVITFGSPCQDLSVAGKRAGLEGDRSGLFHQAIRIIKEMREVTNGNYPTVAIWENVPGALSSRNGNDFARVLTEMADLGAHTVEWAVLDAQYFGVPQRRRRVYVVAILGTATPGRDIAPIFDLREGRRRNTKTSRGPRETTTADIETSARANSGDTYVKTVRSGARDADGNLPPEVWQPEPTAPTLNSFDNGGESRATVLVLDGTRVNDVRVTSDETAITLTRRMGTGGNNVPFISQPDPVTAMAIPIQGTVIGRSDTAGPQGRGIGDIGDPSYTLDSVSRHGVAQGLNGVYEYAPVVGALCAADAKLINNQSVAADKLVIQAADNPQACLRGGGDGGVPSSRGEHLVTTIGFSHTQGLDPQPLEDATPTLRAGGGGMAVAFDEYNGSLNGDDIHHALRAGTRQSTGVLQSMTVRRLTPIECERLQGWPDNHTLYRADGKTNPDSTRYKMTGNGVAAPVAKWIAEQLNRLLLSAP